MLVAVAVSVVGLGLVGATALVTRGGSHPDGAVAGSPGEPGTDPDAEVLPALGSDGATPGVGAAVRVMAESNLHAAVVPVETSLAETGDFGAVTPALLAEQLPSVAILGASEASGKASQISMSVTARSVVLSARAGPEDCAYLRDDLATGAGVEMVTVRTGLPCSAANAPASGWTGGFGGGMGAMDPGTAGDPATGGVPPMGQTDGYPIDPADPSYYGG